MIIPSSTYRLQIASVFTLENVKEIVPYLQELGISTIYAAPVFKSRPDSTHGYDVTDPHIINPQIGSLEELEEITSMLRERNMGWLQDIVPNHMAFDTNNLWLMDVLEKGKHSEYFSFFDINWYHPEPRFKDKIMAPFLGAPLEEVIQNGDVSLFYNADRFVIKAYENEYPVSVGAYAYIFEKAGNQKEHQAELKSLVAQSQTFSSEGRADIGQFEKLKEKLKGSSPSLIEEIQAVFNQDKSLLAGLLEKQNFRLTYWRRTEDRINYRRFFTVNDLICLNMENPEVFDHYHQFIKKLYDEGQIQGVRVDHIDGLNDPTEYLQRLRKLLGDDAYIIVEKILEWEERLPGQWSIQGTSGYGFLATASHLFTDKRNKGKFHQFYEKHISDNPSFKEMVFEKKYFIFKNRMAGELDNLMVFLMKLDILPAENVNIDGDMKEALAIFLVSFPVYRIYSNQFPLAKEDEDIIESTFLKAEKQAPHLKEAFSGLRQIFVGKSGDQPEMNRKKLRFLRRCQQFTGPLEAKGVEDTSFYIYNRLISHNEVGDTPEVFGIDAETFHERMQRRFKNNPLSINATATHDTKRGEDARMRINAISEMPDLWAQHVKVWMQENETYKTELYEKTAPTKNDEYFIYQTIMGVLSMDGEMGDDFLQRVQEYMTKVVREAKENTSWAEPDLDYEQATSEFIEAILMDNRSFLASFLPIFRQVARLGCIYSLAQTLVKITAPGIPDIYQGTELWDLSMVDPDNRRPVDYGERISMLGQLNKDFQENASGLIDHLLDGYADGKIKMFTLNRALHARNEAVDIFEKGDYIPLEVRGEFKENVLAYARKVNQEWRVIVIPRLLNNKLSEKEWPVGMKFWMDTDIVLPEDAPKCWVNIFTKEKFDCEDAIFLEQALSIFPVAFLKPADL